ncbi:hypothetical protein SLEP1_g45964 [Rubroshorea leprosula]|uniref:Uncharacterized protein n=1 Tax=Rubroshorea leprosula TaxID=152421 RepID=A0AAV5LMM8_9ROSI|nr:hypothetical protein SLEP1_g45964 [Rubroshorea leprosula]
MEVLLFFQFKFYYNFSVCYSAFTSTFTNPCIATSFT